MIVIDCDLSMHHQYPVIFVKFHVGTEYCGDGFWIDFDENPEYSLKYVAAPDGESPTDCIWACEEVIGFGYGQAYLHEITEQDEEKWPAQQRRYKPA